MSIGDIIVLCMFLLMLLFVIGGRIYMCIKYKDIDKY